MFVRRLSDVVGTERDVDWGSGQSRRLLIKKDNMGFAFLDTIVNAGTDVLLQYRHHLESVYCIEGEGEIIDQIKNESHIIGPAHSTFWTTMTYIACAHIQNCALFACLIHRLKVTSATI